MLIIALLSAFCYYLLSHFIATISILNWNGEAFFGACLSVHHFFFCPRHGLISQWLRLGILVLAMAIEIVVTDLAVWCYINLRKKLFPPRPPPLRRPKDIGFGTPYMSSKTRHPNARPLPTPRLSAADLVAMERELIAQRPLSQILTPRLRPQPQLFRRPPMFQAMDDAARAADVPRGFDDTLTHFEERRMPQLVRRRSTGILLGPT